ncbi:Small polypeptide DEVIL 5 [Linum grandiflorum]
MELPTSQKRKVASSTKRNNESQPKDGVMKAAKGRFYVIRRCIVMLLCWKENEDK